MSAPFDYQEWLEKQPGRSYDMVRRVQKLWGEMHAGRQPGFEVELVVATQFGLRRVAATFAQGPGIIVIAVAGHTEGGEIIHAPVEQCSFMLRHFRPTTDKPRVIVGFAPPQNAKDAS